jgi:hypothetical protein
MSIVNTISNKTDLLKESLGIIDGVFLLFLAISGNFIAETLGCQTQELLSNSVLAKQCMTFFIIFFTIDYSDDSIEAPTVKLMKAALVYVFFLLFTKMDIKPTILVFVILFGIYISNSYKDFYNAAFKEIKKSSKEEIEIHNKQIEKISNLQQTLMGVVIVVILAGFFMYLKEKKIEYKESFVFKKFIFGVVKCKGMN